MLGSSASQSNQADAVVPRPGEYRTFPDRLLSIYNQAKQFAANRNLNAAARKAKVNKLDSLLSDLLASYCRESGDPGFEKLEKFDNDFENLVSELARLMLAEELFTFVLYPAATGTNNEAERSLRYAAMDRPNGTNKQDAQRGSPSQHSLKRI